MGAHGREWLVAPNASRINIRFSTLTYDWLAREKIKPSTAPCAHTWLWCHLTLVLNGITSQLPPSSSTIIHSMRWHLQTTYLAHNKLSFLQSPTRLYQRTSYGKKKRTPPRKIRLMNLTLNIVGDWKVGRIPDGAGIWRRYRWSALSNLPLWSINQLIAILSDTAQPITQNGSIPTIHTNLPHNFGWIAKCTIYTTYHLALPLYFRLWVSDLGYLQRLWKQRLSSILVRFSYFHCCCGGLAHLSDACESSKSYVEL